MLFRSPASTQAESGASEAAPSSRPVVESWTRPVAESEGASTPPKEHSRIHWVAEWDIPAQEEPKKATREESALSTRKESTLFLLEEKAQVNLAQGGDAKEGVWYLDSGATNHMTGDRAAFAELDTSIVGTVKFGDGSRVDICGQGTVLFVCKSGEHRAVTGVYLIPWLNTQIISLGQVDENGCQVLIEDGLLRVRDRERQLLVKVIRLHARCRQLVRQHHAQETYREPARPEEAHHVRALNPRRRSSGSGWRPKASGSPRQGLLRHHRRTTLR